MLGTQTPIVFATLFVTGSVPEVINISTFLIGLSFPGIFFITTALSPNLEDVC